MENILKILLIVTGIVVALIFLGWLGLQVKPAPFAAFSQKAGEVKTMPLPQGLPAPVERFYRVVYGENIPVITSAVIDGRASMRPFGGISLPARFRFSHEAGQNYRHYIEATWFGIPIMQVNERYLDGRARMELPFGVDEGKKLDQAANLGMWAEALWFPAIFLTDVRVQWQALDDDTAILVVPFNDGQDHFVVRFDPETGLINWFESMRYHDSNSPAKVLWLNHGEWGERDGRPFSTSGASTWMDDGKPWAVFTVEDVVFNADISETIRSRGL